MGFTMGVECVFYLLDFHGLQGIRIFGIPVYSSSYGCVILSNRYSPGIIGRVCEAGRES